MFQSNGEGGGNIYYKSHNKVAISTNGVDRITVSDASTDVSNDLNVSGDVNAAGGFVQSFVFIKNNALQNQNVLMTSSIGFITSSDATPVCYTRIPMCRAGSVRGLVVSVANTTECVKSGALSCSVMIDSVKKTDTTAVVHTGTFFLKTVAKDLVTFTAGQTIGVMFSASSLFLSDPNITSASFIATVLVEQ